MTPNDARGPTAGRALCLSGGGYRAMLFHVGVLWRLNELGWLPSLDRISSVSGGSITGAVLGLAWNDLDFRADGVTRGFTDLIVAPLRSMASVDVDVAAVRRALLLKRTSVGAEVARAYGKHLYGTATLQDLVDRPRFVFNATNVGSGALVRFSKPYLGDWRVGRIFNPEIPLAVAVACSSAFPPFLSPYRLNLRGQTWQTDLSNDLVDDAHRDEWLLTDGGVYDNLGIETAWKQHRTVLISDAGGQLAPERNPHRDWPRHLLRTLNVVDHQVRALRKRQVIGAFQTGERDGAYLGIRSNIAQYPAKQRLHAPHHRTMHLAAIPTRLARIAPSSQEQLINWGYAICDATMRAHVTPEATHGAFPYPVGV